MKTLLLYLSEDEQFDLEKITSILKNSLDKNSLKEDHLIGAILEGEFSYQNDFTLVRLSDSLETISLDGLGDASLKLALEIQKHYPKPIQAIDSDYNFDICLNNIELLSEFRQKIFNHSEEGWEVFMTLEKDALDILRSREVEQEVLDLLDEPET